MISGKCSMPKMQSTASNLFSSNDEAFDLATILAKEYDLPDPKLTELQARELISVERFIQTFPNYYDDPFGAPDGSDK
jgi:hypothetical protein